MIDHYDEWVAANGQPRTINVRGDEVVLRNPLRSLTLAGIHLRVDIWRNGERDRAPRVSRPCECGCENAKGVGYLTWSDAEGTGVTVWLPDEVTYARAVLLADDFYAAQVDGATERR